MTATKNAAVLVGNGLSIAFNPDLNLRLITEEVMQRIERADGGDVVAAMKELAERALPHGVTSDSDFELLVGAFGAESRTMRTFQVLASLTSPKDTALQASIRRVASFAEEVRDNGISHVLQVIAERSRAYAEDATSLHALVTAVIKQFRGRVVFGNLNYDTLLLAALMRACDTGEVADLAHGWKRVTVRVNGGEDVEVPALRATKADFPPRHRIQLLHLHGSLTYWASREDGFYAKLPRSMLEDGSQWQAIRDKTTNVKPVVVLSNQRDKAAHVDEYPFQLGYEMFGDGLEQSDHWLIIGYSFKDEPVNALLRRIFLSKDEKPTVLVVTYGKLLARTYVEQAFGWRAEDSGPSDWLTINREGANGVQDAEDWARFVGAP